jgi:hypothetical protein
MKEGLLLRGSYDNKICLWDLVARCRASVLDAEHVFEVMPHWTQVVPFSSFFVLFNNITGHFYVTLLQPRELTNNVTSV